MKKIVQVFLLVIFLSVLTVGIIGCDEEKTPTKPGGGGYPQPYNPDDGRYE